MAGDACPVALGCNQGERISSLEQQQENVKDVLRRLDGKTDLILEQISKVAVLEVSHNHHKEAVDRAFGRIETLERGDAIKDLAAAINERMSKAETSLGNLNEFKDRTIGMGKLAYALWGALGAGVFLLFVKVLFFMGASGLTPG